jgi:PleD family two-component response regulator
VILAIVDDLMFTSKLRNAAKAVDAPLTFSRSMEGALAAMRTAAPSLVILDLNNPRIDALAIVEAMKQDATLAAVPTLGFSQHTDTATIAAARTAGVDQVMARSSFFDRLPELLKR